jgi:hypothetical protein
VQVRRLEPRLAATASASASHTGIGMQMCCCYHCVAMSTLIVSSSRQHALPQRFAQLVGTVPCCRLLQHVIRRQLRNHITKSLRRAIGVRDEGCAHVAGEPHAEACRCGK